MSDLSVTNTFVALTTAIASQVNQNFSDIVNYINNRDDGSATWDNMNVTATVANPVTIKSNQATTEVAIDNTAADGDPILTFKLSGAQTHVIGVDDSDSDFLKFGTTGLTTNVAMQIPTVGAQVQFNDGTLSLPGMGFLSDTNTGVRRVGTDQGSLVAGGADIIQFGLFNSVNVALFRDGTAARPALSFINDQDSGLYSVAGNQIGIAANGGDIVRIGIFSGTAQTLHADGAETAPAVAFINDVDSGFWRVGANTVAISTNGVKALQVDADATAGVTRLLVYDVNSAAVVRVSRGANDSGGAGFALLRIPN